MVGKILSGHVSTYTVTKSLTTGNRPNANIYLCVDEKGTQFIAKHFYDKPPVANIALSKYNHYGRRRDGSERVFNEIQNKNENFPFLVKHIERIYHDGKWLIILEYVEGDTLSHFIEHTYQTDISLVLRAVQALALTLNEWHSNRFAHGDPHLDNAIVQIAEDKSLAIRLIDYCQIHHPDFHYCQEYHCYDNYDRIKEDLFQPSGKLGGGFKSDLKDLDEKLQLNGRLSSTFDNYYSYRLV